MVKQLRLDTFRGKLEPLAASGGRKYDIMNDRYKGLYSINPCKPFLLDEIEIRESQALKRLPGKMQVISTPHNNHISNRRSHTDRVAGIAVQIAYMLGLNVDFCRAAALGHDVGHCPYGPHGGEILGIKHPLNGAVMLLEVEGLNLTKEVVRAILYHSLDSNSLTNGEKLPNEAFVVALADKFAYLPEDWEDFKRSKMLKNLTPPEELLAFGFGNGEDFPRKMTEICVNALMEESLQEGIISFSKSETAMAFQKIRKWSYDEIYNKLNDRPERAYHKVNLKIVLEYFVDKNLHKNLAPEFAVSMMTDNDVNWLSGILKDRNPTEDEKEQINQLSVIEIIRSLKGKEINHKQSPLW